MPKLSLAALAGLAIALPAAPLAAQTTNYLMVMHADSLMLCNPTDGSIIDQTFIPNAGPAWNVGGVQKGAIQVGNEIWVGCQLDDDILRFDFNGRYYGRISENINNIRGMVYHDGVVYVTNADPTPDIPGGNGIVKFSPTGQYLGSFAAGTNGPWDVVGIGTDLFITEDDVIHRYGIDGTNFGIFHDGQIDGPRGIVRRTNGNLWAAGNAGTSIRGFYEYDSTGAQVGFQTTGTNAPQSMVELGNGQILYTAANIFTYDPGTAVSTQILAGAGHYIHPLTVNTAAVGACCLLDGTCQTMSIADCDTAAGVFRGDGVTCANAACPASGACCMPDGTCVLLPEDYCTTQQGIWRGASTTCQTANCPTRLITPNSGTSVSTDGSGIFFALTPNVDISIPQIDYSPGVTAGTPVIVDIYTREGGYVGFDTDPTAWTHLTTISTTSLGNTTTSVYTPLVLPTSLTIDANQTLGVYLVGTDGGYRYRSSTGANPIADANLSLESNLARSAPFAGTASTGRRFMGTITYFTETTPPVCYANCDGSTTAPVLNVADFTCFLQQFAAGASYANCDNSTTEPTLNVADFTCFLQQFAAGCP